MVIIDDIVYTVTNKIYDFDKLNIAVGLLKIKEGTN